MLEISWIQCSPIGTPVRIKFEHVRTVNHKWTGSMYKIETEDGKLLQIASIKRSAAVLAIKKVKSLKEDVYIIDEKNDWFIHVTQYDIDESGWAGGASLDQVLVETIESEEEAVRMWEMEDDLYEWYL